MGKIGPDNASFLLLHPLIPLLITDIVIHFYKLTVPCYGVVFKINADAGNDIVVIFPV